MGEKEHFMSLDDALKSMVSKAQADAAAAKGNDGSPQSAAPAAPGSNASQGGVTPPSAPAADSAVSDYEKQVAAFKTKALDETKKRQSVEMELAELKGMLAVLQQNKQPPQGPPEENDDEFWADPKGHTEKKIGEALTAFEQKAWVKKRDWSVKEASSKYEDYFDVASEFEKKTRDPKFAYLAQEAFEHPHPAEFAYQTMKQLAAPETDVEKLKAELREQILAEYKDQLKQTETKTAPQARNSLAGLNSPPTGGTAPPLKAMKQLLKEASAKW